MTESISWDAFFMSMCECVSQKSKDTSTKVGSVIVGPENEVRSLGFNGFPRGVQDTGIEIQNRYMRPQKYKWTEHAERNAIYNAARMGVPLRGTRIYVPYLPCCDCMRAIIQSGIESIIIGSGVLQKHWVESWGIRESLQMSIEAHIVIHHYERYDRFVRFPVEDTGHFYLNIKHGALQWVPRRSDG